MSVLLPHNRHFAATTAFPSWLTLPERDALYALNFKAGEAWDGVRKQKRRLEDVLACSRASSGYAPDASSGSVVWTSFPSNTLRYTPASEVRTNYIRNNSMQGAAAGTPGTLPTNWTISTAGGLSRQVVGTGTQNGVDYVDIRIAGTTTDASPTVIGYEASNQITAVQGQAWALSHFVAMVGGSLTNIASVRSEFYEATSSGSYLVEGGPTFTLTSSLVRQTATYTLVNASTARVWAAFRLAHTSGTAVDITVRVGSPQLEQAADASNPMRTAGSTASQPWGGGVLVEESRTNSIRNNSGQGAVAGTPGTVPTNHTFNAGSGLTRQIVGAGTTNGIEWTDYRVSGTAGASSQSVVAFETTSAVAAVQNQVWTESAFLAVSAGSLSGCTVGFELDEYSSTPAYLTSGSASVTPTSTLSRYSYTRTIGSASAAYVRPLLYINHTNGAAIDVTIRIGWPQLEQGAFATSPIRTTSAAVTRSADAVTAAVSGLTAATVVAIGKPSSPTSNAVNQILVSINDSSSAKRLNVIRFATNGYIATQVSNISSNLGPAATVAVAQDTRFAVAAAYGDNDRAFSLNGAAVSSDATSDAFPTGLTQLNVGSRLDGTILWNGLIERLVVFPTRKSNADLQAMSQLSFWGG